MTDSAILAPTPPSALKVSFSRLNLFHRCPRQFRYRHVDQLHEPKSLYAGAGSLFHSALEANPSAEDMRALIRRKGRAGHTDEATQRALTFVDAFAAFREAEGEVKEVAREVEILFYWEDPEGSGLDIRFHGFVDRIIRGQKGLIIDDWKLGQVYPSDIAQLQVYAPLIEQQFGEPVSLLRDVYLRKGGKYKVKQFVPALGYEQVIDLMGDMAHMFYRVGFYPAWGALNGACGNCSFSDRCEWVGMSHSGSVKRKG